jgi:PAS domain S-box-containing protein
MNSQPNRTEQPPEPRNNETEPRGIIDSIPATADLDQKASSQPNDQRPDFHSLNSMIRVPMEIGRFLPLAVAITGAVKEVHQGGLIHKDIKPDNILVSETGDVHLTGFDIASRLPRERQLPAPPEFIAGTLAYMAPEQTGRMNRSIDARSDLYALGVTLYEMITGSLPFTASEPMEWVHCHIARQAVPPLERSQNVPVPVSAIIMKLLAKTPEERYQTAAGVERDLRHCLEDWYRERDVHTFPLGEHDKSDRLLIPEKLYGREREVGTLLASFDRVVKSGMPELVLVSGYSGIGKSSVVNELHKVLVLPRGLFASGKFDQYKRDIPYATLVQAFQSLLRPLLTKSEAELSKCRDVLRQALDPNAQLIVDLVPELRLIIGDQPAVPELPPQDARRRFHMVFRRFISVFARPEHPLALFLDDLQWLDAATLDLIEDLLSEPDVTHLMLIGAYRDNEVDAMHPLMRKLEAIRQRGAIVHDIVLAPLAREDLEQLIVDTLHCELDRAKPLAQLVEDKTGGNPFFAIRFIVLLAEEGLLAFDHGEGRWSWDLNRIGAKGYTDNVVDLMVGKLRRLPQETQSALQHLACLGHTAGISVLTQLFGASEEQLDADLWEAVRFELVERAAGSYRFVHDRIQEAAYSLIPEESRAASHLRIGRLLAENTPPEKREEAIFEIVNQLNRATALITSPDEREQVAELNLIAGRRAKASTAYASALNYLTAGWALLTEETWDHNYDLVFEIEYLMAECELLTAEMVASENRLSMLAQRAKNRHDVAIVTRLRITLYTMLDRGDRCVEVFLEYLRHAGTDWPLRPTHDEVMREYDRIWSLLENRQIEDLVDLPLLTDPEVRDVLDVFTEVAPPSLFFDENLFSLVICRMVNLSLEHGNCDAACFAYLCFAVIAGPRFSNYNHGFRFGRLGYELVEKRGLKRYKARTYLLFGHHVMPWARHVLDGRDLLRRAFDTAYEVGDLIFAASSRNSLISNLLMTGDPLSGVQAEAENCLAFDRRARYGWAVDVITSGLRLIRTLRGFTPKFGCFNDEDFDEIRFEGHLAGNPTLVLAECSYWIRKLQARFLAGDYTSALEASLNAQRLLWSVPSTLEGTEFSFYGALSHAASWDLASPDQRDQHVEALGVHHRQLEIWAEHCPENFENRAALVGAEIARIEGRLLDAEQLYEKAIRSAHANHFVHNEALANEVAARFYAARGFEKIAHAYLHDARYCYQRWGADGKVRQLDELYPYLREDQPVPGPMKTMGAPVEHLDLATVIKVSQAISSEMVLDKLVDALMRTALQQAGADRGALLLLQMDALTMAAEAATDGGGMVVSLDKQPAANADLPQSVLQYVHRTLENVILDDATIQNPYTTDSYIRQCHPRSVLCLPLLNQGKLIGILYLENKLAPRVFVPARIAVLKLLASQAAISLENSRLYRDLAEREARIRRLVEGDIIGVFIWDLEGRIYEANETFLRMMGYSRVDLAAGRLNWRELTPPEWREIDERHLQDVRKTGRVPPFEKEYFRKDGTRVPILLGAVSFDEDQSQGVAFVLDLTERKRAEEATRRSEKELRDVLEQVPAMVFAVLQDGRQSYVSTQWYEYTGLSETETLDEGWQNAIHSEDAEQHMKKYHAAVAAGQPFESEVRLRRAADGQYRWFLIRVTPLRDEAGNVVKWYGFISDIEDRKRAEQERERLRKLEAELAEKLRDVIETMPTMVWTALPDGSEDFINRHWHEYSGLSAGQSAGSGWQAAVHPADLKRHLEKWRTSLATGEPFENEVRYRRAADGQYRWFLSRAVPLRDGKAEIVKWYGVSTDIEERKRAEQALKRSEEYLAEGQRLTHTGSWALNVVTRQALHSSAEHTRMFGFDPEKGMPSFEQFLQRVHPEDQEHVLETFQALMQMGGDLDLRYRIAVPGSPVTYVHAIGHPVLKSGTPGEYVGITIDITERRRIEQERERLQQLEADLAHINRVSMMGEMAASLAHEIKQPITAATTNAQICLWLLEREKLDVSEMREASSAVAQSVRRAADIIERVRSLSKKSAQDRELVDVNQVVLEIDAMLRNESRLSSVMTNLQLSASVPQVTGDRVQLQQVVMNLMLNAIEAMKDSGGELVVTSERTDGGQVLVSVSDSGIGLPEGKEEHIFDAFFTTKSQGTGMGLAISRSIIESHGGRLWARPNPDRGVTFCFELPQYEPDPLLREERRIARSDREHPLGDSSLK